MEEIKLNDHQRWQGRYKCINFQICKWKHTFKEEDKEFDSGYTWNFYIFVKPRPTIKTEEWKIDDRTYPPRIDYYKMYSDVNMHGDITYFSRHTNSDLSEVDEIGCDYSHLFDYDGSGYGNKKKENTVEWVMRDVKECIDTLPKDLFFN